MPASANASLTNVGNGNTLPADQPIVLQFNRLLNPYSVTRQSILILSGVAEPQVDYDPVLMTVTLSNPMNGMAWLVAGQSYQVSFPVPQNANDINGLHAIDGATFAAPAQIGFMVGPPSGAVNPSDAGNATGTPTMHFCVDILPIFTSNCTGSTCHSSPSQGPMPEGGATQTLAAGLILDNSAGVALTAIGQVAHGSNTGASAGTPESPAAVFGIDMPIIDPGTGGTGDPANSWLLYKLLLATPSTAPDRALYECSPDETAQSYDQGITSPAAMAAERIILSDFILGNQMPYPSTPTDSPNSGVGLSVQDLERLRLWIAQGALTADCSSCMDIPSTETDASADAPPVEPSDAGSDTSTGAPADAGTSG